MKLVLSTIKSIKHGLWEDTAKGLVKAIHTKALTPMPSHLETRTLRTNLDSVKSKGWLLILPVTKAVF